VTRLHGLVLVVIAIGLGACSGGSDSHDASDSTQEYAAGTGGGSVSEAACDLLTDQGCAEGQHCQALGANSAATCVAKGKIPVGERCTTAAECESGTCDQRVCREYCQDRCTGGKCLPATTSDNREIAGVSVCVASCQIDNPDSCADGSFCRVREIDGVRAAICLAPDAVCATTEDGVCDEPNTCDPGTDAFDCSCVKAIAGAKCDLVSQCGCARGMACDLAGDGDSDPVPACVASGTGTEGEPCGDNGIACDVGLGCFGSAATGGTCKKYCETDADCNDTTTCVETAYAGVKLCASPSSRSTEDDDAARDGGVAGSSAGSCNPEYTHGECSLAEQCGCEGKRGTSCELVDNSNGDLSSACVTKSGTAQTSASCTQAADCDSGLVCYDGICRSYCDGRSGCDDGYCIGIEDEPFGICLQPCDTAVQNSCPDPQTVCTAEALRKSDGTTLNVNICELKP